VHDHYDHLDYETIKRLKSKVKQVVCGLGVGAHFEHWNYDPSVIIEKDWNEEVRINDAVSLYTAPARHFSGRGLKRNNTLWLSFVLQSPDFKMYLGGDSGYDTRFKAIGEKFGDFDLGLQFGIGKKQKFRNTQSAICKAL
jgi:L-ascorbate metabolism protein UlaG (beta-lactamase superfamily)